MPTVIDKIRYLKQKSMCMYFSIAWNNLCRLQVIYVSNSLFQFARKVKYLEVMKDFSMKTNIDITRQILNF